MTVLPAYAGMIPGTEPVAHIDDGAPRVCGDDPEALCRQLLTAFVLPAYAGMIPLGDVGHECLKGAPRVCGDDPV